MKKGRFFEDPALFYFFLQIQCLEEGLTFFCASSVQISVARKQII
ncbi:hypothetical protein N824_15435 [Pedobacter sp. V48]|nr:hypothetical protein N824_15435 [Pedobacter sp. V48]